MTFKRILNFAFSDVFNLLSSLPGTALERSDTFPVKHLIVTT